MKSKHFSTFSVFISMFRIIFEKLIVNVVLKHAKFYIYEFINFVSSLVNFKVGYRTKKIEIVFQYRFCFISGAGGTGLTE